MSDDKTIHDLDDTDEVRRLRAAVEAEREECVKIAERHLGQLYHGHGATGEQIVMAIISEIRERGSA